MNEHDQPDEQTNAAVVRALLERGIWLSQDHRGRRMLEHASVGCAVYDQRGQMLYRGSDISQALRILSGEVMP